MNNQHQAITFRVIVPLLFVIVIVIVSLLPLLISGRWNWLEGWIYALVNILGFVMSRALAARRHPDLLAERARMMQHTDATSWDKRLAPMVVVGGMLIAPVVGLDARFDWSPTFSSTVKIISLIIMLGGFALGSYALIENRFFSGVVRIQTDRGHHVISSGPYRWVRHPGYAGAIMNYLATPLFLDAVWAFVPAVLVTILLVIRTRLEDKTLQTELEGYHEYASRVRYRLLPRIW